MAILLPSKPANFDNLAHRAFLSCSPNRAATDSRDENLKAKSPAAAGGSKEERKREHLSEPTRSILIPSPMLFTTEPSRP